MNKRLHDSLQKNRLWQVKLFHVTVLAVGSTDDSTALTQKDNCGQDVGFLRRISHILGWETDVRKRTLVTYDQLHENLKFSQKKT